MPTLITNFNFGRTLEDKPELNRQLNQIYVSIAQAVNGKISKNVATSDPPADDQVNINFEIGDIWVNTSSDTAWIMTSRTSNTAVTWTQIT